MTTITSVATIPGVKELERSARKSTRTAFRALFLRDLTVLRKSLKEFLPRTLLQPFLLVFIFTYVFPKIGQGVGGSGAAAAEFSTRLVAGVIGLSIMFQGIQSVALPMVQEFGYTREIEDRVLAPMPVAMVMPEVASKRASTAARTSPPTSGIQIASYPSASSSAAVSAITPGSP